jgi:hypothetical protein
MGGAAASPVTLRNAPQLRDKLNSKPRQLRKPTFVCVLDHAGTSPPKERAP